MEGIEGFISGFPDSYKEILPTANIEQRVATLADVGELSKDTGYFFLHGMHTVEQVFDNALNASKDHPPSLAQRVKIVVALQPTISVHTRPEDFHAKSNEDVMVRKKGLGAGVILNGGEVVAAYPFDAGTVAKGIKERIFPKRPYGLNFTELDLTRFPEDVRGKLKDIVRAGKDMSSWNEFIVANPEVAGIYIHDFELEILKKKESWKGF